MKKEKISVIITRWLIVIVVLAFILSSVITCVTLISRSQVQTLKVLRRNVEDVSTDIEEIVDNYILDYVDEFIDQGYIDSANIEDLDALNRDLEDTFKDSGTEVNVVDANGIIIASSVPEYIGYDMASNEQSAEFLKLLDGETEYFVQGMREQAYDQNKIMKYSGERFKDGSGFIQIGLAEDVYYKSISEQGKQTVTNRRLGDNGYLMICDANLNILNSYHNEHTGVNLSDAGINIDPKKDYEYEEMTCDVFGVSSDVCINSCKGIFIIGVYPKQELISRVLNTMNASALQEIFVFSVLLLALIILLRKTIVKNMVKVNRSLSEIAKGNLEERVDVRDTYEFDNLSNDINATVDKLQEYIREAAARIDADLAVAKAIQEAVLPNVFPPFPEHKEFELYASMHAAKEVGGDFYDFYMVDKDTLGFLVADVSGKSIPGAMFMMRGKAIIKNLAESGKSPADVFYTANNKLYEGNDALLFITAWMGYLDLKTGLLHLVNAGHNPPVLIRRGKAEYVDLKHGMMLAVMSDMKYEECTLQLEKDDILFLYTDGVTEAIDPHQYQYGEERLLNLLSFGDRYPEPEGDNCMAGTVCELVKKDLDSFVSGAEQFDDITMLCVRYLGES